MAEDTALRLAPAQPAPSAATAAAAAAATAAVAVAHGATPEEATAQGQHAAVTAQPDKPSTSAGPLATLVKYIPTETITLYVAILGALGDVTAPKNRKISDANFASRWIWVWVMVGVTVLLTVGLSYRSQKNANPAGNAFHFKVPYFEVLAAAAAFVVWALSLPSTPLRDIAGYDYTAWNSVIILGGTITIATAAYVLGKTVSWQKVLDS